VLDRLDAALWQGAEDSFLPHGRAGGPHDGAQPVLLTTAMTAANRPDCLVSIEGAPLAPEELGALARAMILFDGQDGAALATARAQWKALTAAGIKAKYWSEESGRWAMKAES
jgi:DNA polymerase-3 subunit chi